MTFDDGTVAEVRKEKELPLLKDHRYALFTLDSTEEAGLRPVGADEGVFELLSDGSVSPHAYYSWDALQAAKQLNQEQFLSKVQIAAHEEKSASQRLGRIRFLRFNDVPNVPSPSLEDAAQPSQNANDPGGSTVESIRAVSERL